MSKHALYEWLQPLIAESDNLVYLFLAILVGNCMTNEKIALMIISVCLVKVKSDG